METKGILRIEDGKTRIYGTIRQASQVIRMLKSCIGMSFPQVRAGINHAIEHGCEFPARSGITWDEL